MTSELPRPPSKRQKTDDAPPYAEDSGSPCYLRVGSCDFPLRMTQKSYFVDKSMFIEEVVQSSRVVNVILRPPRFGKSLNLSMLHSFFDVNSSHRQLFNGLMIEQNHPEYFEPDGPFSRHPVIHFDLKDTKEESCICGASHKYETDIAEVYKQFDYLLQSDKLSDAQKKEFKECRPDKIGSTRLLSRLLCLHHKSPCVILVDNYDSALHGTRLSDESRDAGRFLGEWFSDILINNAPNIFKVVIMGFCYFSFWDDINRRIRESDSEQQSEIGVRTWADAEFSDHFGFSEDEVTQMFNYCGCSADVPQVLSFYSGYRTRKGLSLSNPYSIMRYLTERSIQPHLDDQMGDACQNLYPLLFQLLLDRCSPSPRRGVRIDARLSSSLCIGSLYGYDSSTFKKSSLRALYFGFLGLSDEEAKFCIPTLESLGCWVGRAFRCGYPKEEENGNFNQLVSELCNPLFENCNPETLLNIQTVFESRMKLLGIYNKHVERRCCGLLLALTLGVGGYMKRFHTDIQYEKTHNLLRVVCVDGIKSHGFIFQLALPKCNDIADESAVSALGTPKQTSHFLAHCPEVHEACQVGMGIDYMTGKCSVVGYFLKRETTATTTATGEYYWGVSETYNSDVIRKYNNSDYLGK